MFYLPFRVGAWLLVELHPMKGAKKVQHSFNTTQLDTVPTYCHSVVFSAKELCATVLLKQMMVILKSLPLSL